MPPSTTPKTGPSPIQWTTQALNAFWTAHADWARSLPENQPHYAIPAAAIQGPQLQRVFGEKLEIEREFTRLCDANGIVGVWGTRTVAYHHLTRQPLQLDSTLLAAYGWTAQQGAAIQTAAGQSDIAHDRLLGVVGWLLTEPVFLNDVAQLQAEYEALPACTRPNFPLGRVVCLDGSDLSEAEFPAATAAFAVNLRQFLDRWGLTQLATWDLPNPQGPLLPNLLPEGPARPAYGIHIFVPLHYPLQGDDDLLGRVREFQQQQAAELGLPPGVAGIAHHALYAQMFRLIHLDRAVRGRFQDRGPRGIVSALEAAAAPYLGRGGDSVHRLWKWIRTCRRGDRLTIRRLQG
ncbi:MAG: hypothetical protein C0467_32245 [Planctomycetaceae bacterium]|nr:hypothetical protein [Planctomycetaceae bacterium]